MSQIKLRANCIDETGNHYGKLTVIEPVRPPGARKILWRCQCECGKEINCSGSDLRSGRRTSCGNKCNLVNISPGETYNFLTVLERDYQEEQIRPNNGTYWKCKCNLCGDIKTVSGKNLRSGDAKSCGCLKSSGETLTKKILNMLKIPYRQEYSFADLKSPFSNILLRFDFALFKEGNLIGLIEFQGAQHERQIAYFGNKLEQIRQCDLKKKEYCRDHDIPVMYITYINNQLPDEEALTEMIKDFYKGEF